MSIGNQAPQSWIRDRARETYSFEFLSNWVICTPLSILKKKKSSSEHWRLDHNSSRPIQDFSWIVEPNDCQEPWVEFSKERENSVNLEPATCNHIKCSACFSKVWSKYLKLPFQEKEITIWEGSDSLQWLHQWCGSSANTSTDLIHPKKINPMSTQSSDQRKIWKTVHSVPRANIQRIKPEADYNLNIKAFSSLEIDS